MQESYIPIVIRNLELSIMDATLGDEENDIKKLVCS